jgi:hypothetical protein
MSNPTDGNVSPGKDLGEDELDNVAGGAFATDIHSGTEIGSGTGGGGGKLTEYSEECMAL